MAEFNGVVTLHSNGELVQSQPFETKVAPMSSAEVELPWQEPVNLQGDCWLTVSFTTRDETSWAPRGHRVAWDQFSLTPYEPLPLPPRVNPRSPTADHLPGDHLRVSAGDVKATFDVNTGALMSIRKGDRELLTQALVPNFWKVPNDNQYRNQYLTRLGPWRAAATGRTEIEMKAELVNDAIVIDVKSKLPVGSSRYDLRYTISPDGHIHVKADYRPGTKSAPLLPRFGMQLAVPKPINTVRWYGRGPHETYWDRKTGGEIGVFQSTVDEMVFPYARPQDTGNRCDVRWLVLTDESGRGLKIIGDQPLSVSAWPYTMADVQQAGHPYDLPRREFNTISIDWKLHGLGGDNSWGARTHPQYTLPGNQPYSYGFTILAL